MSNTRIGKQYPAQGYIKTISDDIILVEAAKRRGTSVSTLIEPSVPSGLRVDLKQWKQAIQYAQNHENPNRAQLYDVYDYVITDNHLASIIDNRILKVQQSKFKVVNKKSGVEDIEQSEMLQREWFDELIKHIMISRFNGFSLIELFDLTEEGEIANVTLIPPRHVIPEKGLIVKEQGDTTGWDYTSGGLSDFYIPVGNPKDLGILMKAAPNILGKKYAIAAWSQYCELIGVPFRWVTTNKMGDDTRQKQLATIMEKMGRAGWAVLEEGETVSLLENAKGDPTKCFENLGIFLNKEVSKLILGQDGTSDSSNQKGTYGSLQILQEVANDRHEADKMFTKYVINNKVFPRLIKLGYKLEGQWFEWDESVDLDVTEYVNAVKTLSDSGFEVDPEQITEKTGITIIGKKTPSPSPVGEARTEPVERGRGEVKKTTPAGGGDGKKPEAAAIKAAAIKQLYAESCVKCSPSPVGKARTEPVERGWGEGFTSSLSKETERLIQEIYEGKIKKGNVDKEQIKKLAAELRKAITEGYGKTLLDEDLNIVDVKLIRELENNVYMFSGFKTYHQIKELSGKLLDENKKLRRFSDFKREAEKIGKVYNETYLQAEYNHAVASSQMASQWVDIQKDKEILPYLRYNTIKDARVRPEHKVLEGITRKVDDGFWKTYYPQNGWGCRCTVDKLSTGTETDLDKIDLFEIKPLFKGNVGIDGVIYPSGHPFFKAAKADKKKVKEAVKDVLKEMRGE